MRAPAPWQLVGMAAVLWGASVGVLRLQASAVEASPEMRALAARSERSLGGADLLGCFRTILVDLLMFRAQAELDSGNVYELLTLYETMNRLVPRMEAGWFFNAYNLAYNVPEETDDPEARWAYTKRGVDMCRDGQAWVPDSWLLPATEGMILLIRIGGSEENRERLAADTEWDPDARSAPDLAWDAGWRALERPEHIALADHLVHLSLRVMVEDGGEAEVAPARARRLLDHLRAHGDDLRRLVEFWEGYLEGGRHPHGPGEHGSGEKGH